MVYPCACVRNIFVFRANPMGEHTGGSLHTVAKAGNFQLWKLALHSAAQHCHWVCIIQEYRVGAIFFYVFANVKHNWNCPQGAENSGGPPRVANVNIYAVFFWNLNIVTPNIDIAVENCAKNAVRPFQRFGAVFGGDYLRAVISGTDYFLHRFCYIIKARLVNIHKRYCSVLKSVKR